MTTATARARDAADEARARIADLPDDQCEVYEPDEGWDPTGFHVFSCTRGPAPPGQRFMVPLEDGRAVRVRVCDWHLALFTRRYGTPPEDPGRPRVQPSRGPADG
jgi:hypothetical protein